MNVLSDILCNSSPLILSSSYNAPLLSHNAPVAKQMNKQNHLIESLSSVPNVNSISNAEHIGNNIFHSMEPGHHSNTLVSSDYHIGEVNETQSDFGTDPYSDSVQSWFTNDLIKVSENMTSMIPSVPDMYATTDQHNGNLDLLDLGFPPEITTPSEVNCDIGTNCLSNSQSLISVANAHGFHSSESLVMPTFANMNNTSLQVQKSRNSWDKYGNHSVITQLTNAAQATINDIIPCDLNVSNQLLSLTDHIDHQVLNAPTHSSSMQMGQGDHMDMIPDKLPHITLNQIDSILRINNYLDDVPPAFSNQTNDHPCDGYSDNSRMPTCRGNMDMMPCNENSLSNLNMTAFAQHSGMLDISRTLPSAAHLNPAVTVAENTADSAIEQACCFKCKYCDFISLGKMQVTCHVNEVHLKNDIENDDATFYDNSLIVSSNSLLPDTLNPPINSVADLPLNIHSNPLVCSSTDSPLNHIQYSKTSSQSHCIGISEKNLPKSADPQLHVHEPNYMHLEASKTKTPVKVTKVVKKSQLDNDTEILVTNGVGDKLGNNKSSSIANNSDRTVHGLPNVATNDVTVGELSKKINYNRKTSVDEAKTVSPQRRISSHMKAWQKKIKRELGSYICEFKGCNVRFRALDNLEYHRKCHVVTSGKFACPECGKGFDYWGSTAGHLWRHHSTDMELHACNACSFRTYSLSTLENLHKPIHQDKYHFLCDTCGKGFKNGKQLRNHRVIHDKKNSNTAVKKFTCGVCGRQFLKKKFLHTHLNVVHGKQRSYVCSYCQYSTPKSSTLRMHMRQHTGEKPFTCTECNYQTVDHNSLRRHKMTHSGEKPYKCPYCTYACIQSSTYKTHLKKNHPDQSEQRHVFSCTVCTFRTILHDNYIVHMSNHELKSNNRPAPSEIQRPVNVLPLVEAVDISLSQSDHNMFLSAPKDKDIPSYLWNENCNTVAGHST